MIYTLRLKGECYGYKTRGKRVNSVYTYIHTYIHMFTIRHINNMLNVRVNSINPIHMFSPKQFSLGLVKKSQGADSFKASKSPSSTRNWSYPSIYMHVILPFEEKKKFSNF